MLVCHKPDNHTCSVLPSSTSTSATTLTICAGDTAWRGDDNKTGGGGDNMKSVHTCGFKRAGAIFIESKVIGQQGKLRNMSMAG